ncbi:HNH endonuclease signature motif containing protein [Endozoicomonas ascidiicola]|uniref:HNH endonuclease signature motif containing protein n=1 Tax=Endozoicomonas ascidiicola TaxID=1698521 RepID=UPI00083023FC|nr:HNH endonuclease signature motif containing protein [Endozoicomonas ascidiicola]
MPRKALRFETTEEGCFVCTSHKTNPDGYFRKNFNGVSKMFHRVMWKHHHGEIPEGMEIDHLCKNRACCNVKHLRVLERSYHKVITNQTRYLERFQKAKQYWQDNKPTGVELGRLFGVTHSCGSYWIRQWKSELN